MPQNPPEGMPRITPYLYYNNVRQARDWLVEAFGFEKRFEMAGPEGDLKHAEISWREGVVMMGEVCEEAGGKSPAELSANSQSLYIYVDGLDAHCAHAKAAGARIAEEPVEMFWGDRMYTAEDPEGHKWTFAEHVKDVAPEEMKPPEM